jgi:TRAP-type C4-dicarboxylate transport system permease small subunit
VARTRESPVTASNRLEVILIHTLRTLIGLLIISAVLINFGNIVGRYVFQSPFIWSDEVMQFMHIWAVMLGAAILTSHGTHLKMDAVYILASPRVRRTLDVFTNLLGIGVSLYVMYYSYQMIGMMAATGQRSVVARVPMDLMYASIPLGFGSGMLLLFIWFYRLFRGEAPESVTRELAPPPEMSV